MEQRLISLHSCFVLPEISSSLLGMYSRIMALKNKNQNLKVLLAVGGWNFGSGPFSDMVADENLRQDFVKQATQFIRDNQFDGLDLDWV